MTTSDDNIKDILILNKPNDIKLVFSEKYSRILNLIYQKEMSISDMARSLNKNPGSIYYHIKILEKHGLVFLTREEIKGGIVKKFYRTSAKRIVLDTQFYNASDGTWAEISSDNIGRLIKVIEYLGYRLPLENTEDAHDLLHRYDNRMKGMMIDINGLGLNNIEDNGLILKNAINLILGIKIKNDPELTRIYSEFEKLFLPFG